MAENQFEFELNGDKVYTGTLVPETYPVSFKPYPDTKLRSLQEIADIINEPSRPRSRVRWGADKLIDQGRRSSCNAYMAAAILMRSIWLSTGKWVKVSPEYVYMFINGGRDAGSMLDDGMVFVTDEGAPELIIDGHQIVRHQSFKKSDLSMEEMRVLAANAKNQRFGEAYQFDNSGVEKCFHSILNCIAGRGVAGIAVHVGDAYMRSKKIAGFDSGRGNHAVCVDDIICLNKNPKSIEDSRLDSPQSWGTKFGDGGWVELTYQHIAQPMKFHGCYGVRSIITSENDMSTTRIQ